MLKFKTTLLAAVVAATFGSAYAGTVAVTKQVHSTEGLAGVTSTQTSASIGYTVAAAYAVGDKVTFTFTAGSVVAASFPSQLNVAAVNSAVPASAISGMSLGLLNSDDDTVTYRVTSLSQPTDGAATTYTDRTTIGALITLGTVGYSASAVAGTVTVTVSAQTSAGDVLDSAGTLTATIAEAKTQFGTAAVSPLFDAEINVSSMRTAFTGVTSDDAGITITNPTTTGWLNLATVNTTAVNLFGEAGKMDGLLATNFGTAGTNVFTEASAQLAVTYAGQMTNDTITFTPPTGTAAVILESQTFNADVVYNYSSAAATAGTATLATGAAAGEWTLNGASVNIPYMPYSANASQILYVTNDGTQDGDIIVTAFDDAGTAYDAFIVGTATAGSITKITGDVKAGLEAQGFTGGKVSITVTVNAPDADITVYASYNVSGNRAFVNTDQYKGQ
jgi:hypothetical protein